MVEMSILFVTNTKRTNIRHNNRSFAEHEWKSPSHQHIDQSKSFQTYISNNRNYKLSMKEYLG